MFKFSQLLFKFKIKLSIISTGVFLLYLINVKINCWALCFLKFFFQNKNEIKKKMFIY